MHFANTKLFHSPFYTDASKSLFTPLLLLEAGEIFILGCYEEPVAHTEMQNSFLLTQLLCPVLFVSCLQLSPRTCVYPSPQLQSAHWHMGDHDLSNCCHQIQRHFGNLVSVFGAVPLRQAAHHHVGVTNGFHLMGRGTWH